MPFGTGLALRWKRGSALLGLLYRYIDRPCWWFVVKEDTYINIHFESIVAFYFGVALNILESISYSYFHSLRITHYATENLRIY
jgi:hypothetical protein